MRYKHTKEDLEEAVKKSLGIAGVCRELNIKSSGGNYKTLHFKIKKWNIDISHFTGSAWNQGEKFKPFGKLYTLKEILVENSPYRNTNDLKKRLYKEKLKTKKCEECGLTEWNGKDITLELDHINGINTDNRIENLKILCPNCHSQTVTFRSKNIKRLPSNQKEYHLKSRKVERPSKETLIDEIKELGYCGTGRKYGVSDNCIRKWIKSKF